MYDRAAQLNYTTNNGEVHFSKPELSDRIMLVIPGFLWEAFCNVQHWFYCIFTSFLSGKSQQKLGLWGNQFQCRTIKGKIIHEESSQRVDVIRLAVFSSIFDLFSCLAVHRPDYQSYQRVSATPAISRPHWVEQEHPSLLKLSHISLPRAKKGTRLCSVNIICKRWKSVSNLGKLLKPGEKLSNGIYDITLLK